MRFYIQEAKGLQAGQVIESLANAFIHAKFPLMTLQWDNGKGHIWDIGFSQTVTDKHNQSIVVYGLMDITSVNQVGHIDHKLGECGADVVYIAETCYPSFTPAELQAAYSTIITVLNRDYSPAS